VFISLHFRIPGSLTPGSLSMTDQLATLLSEQRRFPPPPEFAARAAATPELYRQAKADRLRFWEDQARTLDWMQPWSRVLEWKPPHAKWFVGGKLNVSVNCLDRHLTGPRRNTAALIWEGEPGDRRTLTYWELAREVNRAAGALRKLGVPLSKLIPGVFGPLVLPLP